LLLHFINFQAPHSPLRSGTLSREAVEGIFIKSYSFIISFKLSIPCVTTNPDAAIPNPTGSALTRPITKVVITILNEDENYRLVV
jgi:hypothetical protein